MFVNSRRTSNKLFWATLLALVVVSAAMCEDGNEASLNASGGAPSSSGLTPASILAKFLEANRLQQEALRESRMEVQIDGRLPKLKREASLRGSRQVAPSGEIIYEAIASSGDSMVRKEVIAKYIAAETEASASLVHGNGKVKSIGINPDNYKFKYKGLARLVDRQAYVFQVTPRQKRLGLFKGEIWVDAETYQSLREKGVFVKNPSIYLRKVEFDRQYELRDGFAVPVKVATKIDTRVGLKAELDVRFSHFSNPLTAQSRFCPLGW